MTRYSGNQMMRMAHTKERLLAGEHLPAELFPDVIARS